jgi:hypothetical protein
MSQQIYLTKEKYEELKKELKERETIIRQKNSRRFEAR